MVDNMQAQRPTVSSRSFWSVIKIVLVINVYTAPISFQNQLLSSATQMNLEMHMLKQRPHLLLLILKGQGLYLRFS